MNMAKSCFIPIYVLQRAFSIQVNEHACENIALVNECGEELLYLLPSNFWNR